MRPTQEIAAQTDGAQVAPPVSKESPSRPQRGPEPPQPDQTYHENQDLDVPRSFVPNLSERPVAGRAKCPLTENMFQQLGLATHAKSTQLTFPVVGLGLTFLRELGAATLPRL